jgi:hypothetical protein
MPADFPSPQTAAPTLEKAAPASASLQTASCQYVYKRYGELGAAMTANVITYRGKSAVREGDWFQPERFLHFQLRQDTRNARSGFPHSNGGS